MVARGIDGHFGNKGKFHVVNGHIWNVVPVEFGFDTPEWIVANSEEEAISKWWEVVGGEFTSAKRAYPDSEISLYRNNIGIGIYYGVSRYCYVVIDDEGFITALDNGKPVIRRRGRNLAMIQVMLETFNWKANGTIERTESSSGLDTKIKGAGASSWWRRWLW